MEITSRQLSAIPIGASFGLLRKSEANRNAADHAFTKEVLYDKDALDLLPEASPPPGLDGDCG